MAAVFGRNQKKYGPRGYRYTLLEAGHSAQNVCLRAIELGLGTLCMGGFEDSRLNRVLGLEPTGGPLHIGAATIAPEPAAIAAFAAAHQASFVITAGARTKG